MALIRWEPAREINSLQGEMNRLFNTFFDTPGNGGTSTRRWIPPMDLVEADDHFVLRADLPGLSEGGREHRGRRRRPDHLRRAPLRQEASEGGHVRVERGFGAFRRVADHPRRRRRRGGHRLVRQGRPRGPVPKPAERKPRRVAIKVGDATPTLEGTEKA